MRVSTFNKNTKNGIIKQCSVYFMVPELFFFFLQNARYTGINGIQLKSYLELSFGGLKDDLQGGAGLHHLAAHVQDTRGRPSLNKTFDTFMDLYIFCMN